MREKWIETTLGDVADVIAGGTPATSVPEYWGGDIVWLTPTEVVAADGHVISTSQRRITQVGLARSGAKLLPQGTVLVTTRATIGATALAGVDLTTNQGFQSLVPHDGVLASFLLYWVQANRSEFARRAGGSTFPEISRTKVLTIPILLPPLAEQRRIVDLIAAVDAAIEAAEWEENLLRDLAVLILGDLYDRMVGPRIAVRDLAELIIGGSWGKPPGVDQCDVIALGTSAYSGDSVRVDIGTGTIRSLSAKRRDSRVLRSGDIILERSGGSDDQPVGRVIWVPDPLVGHVVPSDFMRLVRVDPAKADPAYVFWVMWLRYQRGETVHFQIQSTNIRNLRIPEYLATPIAVPSIQEQHAFVELAESFLEGQGSVATVIKAQASVRSAILSDLLSGDHEISASYDELLSA